MDCLRTERPAEGVARIVLTNAARLNPIAIPMQEQLRDALLQLRDDRTVRAVILTGEGRGFCAGADLTSVGSGHDDGLTRGQRAQQMMRALSNPLLHLLHEMPMPVVCAMNGVAAGAGVALALSADIVVAAKSSYFYLPFMPRLGILPDLGTSWLLERAIGRSRAMALTLLGDRLPAETAKDWGLIWACVDDDVLQAEALALAGRLAALPAHAALETRHCYEVVAGHDFAQQQAYETERQGALLDQPSFAEGVSAFLEKRQPRFAR